MRRNVAKHAHPDRAAWRAYFGCADGQQASPYLKGEDFNCGILGEMAPRQLHDTTRHADGRLVHTRGGYPVLKPAILDALDGIPYQAVRAAVEYLKSRDYETWRALREMMPDRRRMDTIGLVAARLYCDRSTVVRRVAKALDMVASLVMLDVAPQSES